MKKIKPLGKLSFGSKMLRALGKNSGFELPIPSREKNQIDVPTQYPYYDFHVELRNALLEAEEYKAKAILNYQRHNLAR